MTTQVTTLLPYIMGFIAFFKIKKIHFTHYFVTETKSIGNRHRFKGMILRAKHGSRALAYEKLIKSRMNIHVPVAKTGLPVSNKES